MKLSYPFLGLVFISSIAFADANLSKSMEVKSEVTSTVEYSNNVISVYNTGLMLNADNLDGLSVKFRGSVDGKIDEIDSEDFELGRFVKELNIKYNVDTENTALLLSVGKMPTGVKTDQSSPRQVGGVMGIRLGIQPKNIPLIQKWLNDNGLRINRIDITRYNANSENRIDLMDLSETNATAFALYLSMDQNFQTFFIYKTPDSGNANGVTSKTLGASYVMDGRWKPQFFVMNHKSDASYMDLDLLVLSVGAEISPKINSTVSYSRVIESVSQTEERIYNASLSRTFTKNENKKLVLKGTVGVKFVTSENGNDNYFYVRLEARHK